MTKTLDPTAAAIPSATSAAPAPVPITPPTAAELAAALARTDSQIAALEASVAEAKAGHRRDAHAALLAGRDAPAPAVKLANLADHLDGLKGARADLAAQHGKRVIEEGQRAGEAALSKADKLREEFCRRWRLSLAACIAAESAFYSIAGHLPSPDLVHRDMDLPSGDSFQARTVAALQRLRNGLPESHRTWVDTDLREPVDPWDRTLRSVAINHIAELMD
ncbi:MAG: hypothetical protein H0X38_02430 [Planctomycetes bacterium]|nr:hypothetical protein [Planctomycetota bacterium]